MIDSILSFARIINSAARRPQISVLLLASGLILVAAGVHAGWIPLSVGLPSTLWHAVRWIQQWRWDRVCAMSMAAPETVFGGLQRAQIELLNRFFSARIPAEQHWMAFDASDPLPCGLHRQGLLRKRDAGNGRVEYAPCQWLCRSPAIKCLRQRVRRVLGVGLGSVRIGGSPQRDIFEELAAEWWAGQEETLSEQQ